MRRFLLLLSLLAGFSAYGATTIVPSLDQKQTANTILAGPTSGGTAISSFRVLVAADIPAISLTSGVSGVLPIANGGTNASTASITSFNNITGYTAAGATGTTSTNIVFSTSATLTTPTLNSATLVTPALGTPISGVLTSCTGLPLTTGITGTLGVGNGGTGLTAGTSGGILYFSGAGTIASSANLTQFGLVIGGGTGAAPYYLGSVGTTTQVLHGNAAGNPSFSAVSLTADVTGTLPIANGGTGQTTATNAFNALAPTTATGGLIVGSGANTYTNLPIGTNGQVLVIAGGTATWGTASGDSATLPIALVGSNINLGTAIAPTVTDANADVGIGASNAGKRPVTIQTKVNNTKSVFQLQNSVGTSQWDFDNTITSNVDMKETLGTSKQASIQMQSLTETLTLNTGSTTTNTVGNLIPANSFIIGVTYRVTTGITTASSFSVGDSISATRYGTGNAVALGTTGSSLSQTNPLIPFTNGTATTVLITTNVNPGAGAVEITTFYYTLTPPQN